jgi:hypothetical protein
VILIADSRELVRVNGLLESSLVGVDTDHRLAGPEPLEAMLRAVNDTSTRCKTPKENHDVL